MGDGFDDRPVTVVYVHGAGRQGTEQRLKGAFDLALFGRPERSVVARYAQVYWERDPFEIAGRRRRRHRSDRDAGRAPQRPG